MNPAIRSAALAILLTATPGAAGAQDSAAPKPAAPPTFDQVQATIKRMQERLNRLGTAAAERDQALRFLERQVEQATGEITGTGKANESLKGETAALSERLQDLSRDRDALQGEVGERSAALTSLRTQVDQLSRELGKAANARAVMAQELESARASLAAATAREGELAAKVRLLESGAREGAARAAEPDGLRRRLAELEASVGRDAGSAAERIAKAEAEIRAREAAAASLRAEAEGLKRKVATLNSLLAAAESKVDTQQEAIEGLDEQLDRALAEKVEELEKYRSEFFGRLRVALGDRPDLRIVGDRFVFQSELLFASGSASLDPAGQGQLRQLARTLQDVAASIPPGLDWILRVDGHTDRQPIRDATFRSNWELSAARAISVIEFLIGQGIPPEHLAAAGFGEYRPIDPRDDEVAYRRNRRIEFKLTEG